MDVIRLPHIAPVLSYNLALDISQARELREVSGFCEYTIRPCDKPFALRCNVKSIDSVQAVDSDFDLPHVYDMTNGFLTIDPCNETVEDFSVAFTGAVGLNHSGCYLTEWVDNASALVIQCSPCFAPRVFPCTPTHRGALTLSIVINPGHYVHSNAPEHTKAARLTEVGPVERVDFARLSSVLPSSMAVVEAPYAVLTKLTGRVPITLISPTIHASHHTAVEWASLVISFLEELLDVDFPLPKLDIVALPEFPVAAYENWGLLLFRRAALTPSPHVRRAVYQMFSTLAHEITHQWFGQLVSHRFHHEGFIAEGPAKFLQFVAMRHLYPAFCADPRRGLSAPEPLEEEMFYATVTDTALTREEHPPPFTLKFHVDIPHGHITEPRPSRAPGRDAVYIDNLVYSKGGALFNVISGLCGPPLPASHANPFYASLRQFLVDNSHTSVTSNHLTHALASTPHPTLPADVIGRVVRAHIDTPGFSVVEAVFIPAGCCSPRMCEEVRDRAELDDDGRVADAGDPLTFTIHGILYLTPTSDRTPTRPTPVSVDVVGPADSFTIPLDPVLETDTGLGGGVGLVLEGDVVRLAICTAVDPGPDVTVFPVVNDRHHAYCRVVYPLSNYDDFVHTHWARVDRGARLSIVTSAFYAHRRRSITMDNLLGLVLGIIHHEHDDYVLYTVMDRLAVMARLMIHRPARMDAVRSVLRAYLNSLDRVSEIKYDCRLADSDWFRKTVMMAFTTLATVCRDTIVMDALHAEAEIQAAAARTAAGLGAPDELEPVNPLERLCRPAAHLARLLSRHNQDTGPLLAWIRSASSTVDASDLITSKGHQELYTIFMQADAMTQLRARDHPPSVWRSLQLLAASPRPDEVRVALGGACLSFGMRISDCVFVFSQACRNSDAELIPLQFVVTNYTQLAARFGDQPFTLTTMIDMATRWETNPFAITLLDDLMKCGLATHHRRLCIAAQSRVRANIEVGAY